MIDALIDELKIVEVTIMCLTCKSSCTLMMSE